MGDTRFFMLPHPWWVEHHILIHQPPKLEKKKKEGGKQDVKNFFCELHLPVVRGEIFPESTQQTSSFVSLVPWSPCDVTTCKKELSYHDWLRPRGPQTFFLKGQIVF